MKRRDSAGYTILEVLIVLAITTGLFILVAVLFGGKQAATELRQSINDLESKIQTVDSDVANGFYPNGFTCQPVAGGVTVTAAATNPGSNSGCVFLGKVMAFNATDTINIISVVGRQFNGAVGTAPTSSLAEAFPTAITGNPETYTYKYGIQPKQIYDINDGSVYGALAFMSQLSGGSGSSNPLTGSRGTLVYGISTSAFADSIPNTANKIHPAPPTAPDAYFKLLVKGARVCMTGANGKVAEIIVSPSGSTNVLIDAGVGSDCP